MLLALVFLVALQADRPPVGPPDTKNFKPVMTKELEFRIDDYRTAFVGRVVDYQNPDDLSEFVRVYYRQVALVSERAREQDSSEDAGRNRTFSNLNYHQKRESEAIGRVQKEADVFAYVRWRTERDARTGQDIRSAGSYRAALLDQNGAWVLGENISLAPLSEPAENNPEKHVIVGIKFTLGVGTHILRVDQDDLVQAKEGGQ
jgi:hypothetical protein